MRSHRGPQRPWIGVGDPSKRQLRGYRDNAKTKPFKVAPTCFALDPDTHQPDCFTSATSACTATTAAVELLRLAAEILAPATG